MSASATTGDEVVVVVVTYQSEDVVVDLVASLPAGDPIPLHFDTVGHFHRGRAALIAAPRAEINALIEEGQLDHDELIEPWIEQWAADLYRHAA